MLVVFSSIFVADTKIIFRCDFAAPLIDLSYVKSKRNQSCSLSEISQSINIQVISTVLFIPYGLSKQENLSFDRPTKETKMKAYELQKKDVSKL